MSLINVIQPHLKDCLPCYNAVVHMPLNAVHISYDVVQSRKALKVSYLATEDVTCI